MGDRSYERLSAQDGSFVRFEGQGSHAHITAIVVFDEGPLQTARDGLDLALFRRHVHSRLHLFPRYRKRLARTPIQGHSIWVDDTRFDIAQHVRHAALPAPGGEAELKELAGRLASQPLDLTRPLWEMWFVEGFEGRGFATIAKIHHSLIDGVSGVGVLTSLLSPVPETEVAPVPDWEPESEPSTLGFVSDGVARLGEFSLSAARSLLGAVWTPQATVEGIVEGAGAAVETVVGILQQPGETPLNGPPGLQRRFDWLDLDLLAVRDLRKRLDGSLNDVVLTIVTGAVRRRLRARRVKLKGLDFRVTVPVDTRRGPEDDHRANKVSAWFLSLPVVERDPRKRFERVQEQTGRRKRVKADKGVDMFMQLADWTGSSLLSSWFADLATYLRPYNMIVTNVHGPDVPIYLLGAPLRGFYPGLPLFANQGVAVAVATYRDKLHVGLTGDWDLMPDLADFGADMRAALEELQAAVGTDVEPARRRRPRAPRSSASPPPAAP
jgi:WS/DGAT/MGAT family acyltransferase